MTKPQPQKIPLAFFRTAAGMEPVREWLKDLNEHDRHTIGLDLMRVQVALACRHALVSANRTRPVRIDLPNRRIARVLSCAYGGQLVILNGFIKKTRRTPDNELAVARKRQKELAQ